MFYFLFVLFHNLWLALSPYCIPAYIIPLFLPSWPHILSTTPRLDLKFFALCSLHIVEGFCKWWLFLFRFISCYIFLFSTIFDTYPKAWYIDVFLVWYFSPAPFSSQYIFIMSYQIVLPLGFFCFIFCVTIFIYFYIYTAVCLPAHLRYILLSFSCNTPPLPLYLIIIVLLCLKDEVVSFILFLICLIS